VKSGICGFGGLGDWGIGGLGGNEFGELRSFSYVIHNFSHSNLPPPTSNLNPPIRIMSLDEGLSASKKRNNTDPHKRESAANLSPQRRRHSYGGSIPQKQTPRRREEKIPSINALMSLLGGKKEYFEGIGGRESVEGNRGKGIGEKHDTDRTKPEKRCLACDTKLVIDARHCHWCGRRAQPEGEEELEKQVSEAFLQCKIEEEEEYEMRLPSSPQHGYVLKKAFLYFSGVPDTRWYSISIDSWFTGIKPSSRYVAFLQVWNGYVKSKGEKPWPIMENWYGVKDSRGIRRCSYNAINKSVTLDVSHTVKYLSGGKGKGNSGNSRNSRNRGRDQSTSVPDPPGRKPPRLCSEVVVPMTIEGFYIAREGGISLESSPALGREMTWMASNRYKTDREWVESMGAEKIMRVGQTPQYYAVQESAIDFLNDVDVIGQVVL
jgi:hypothetical protein